ncbi:MAG TPA: O-antigen ligase family protein [Geminicoccaceae bacterium]|nr:O-antigen ligase family protein [Geminicoccaceae bacterium]
MSQPGMVWALVAFALGAAALWLSWRRPTVLFLLALAALAIRPQAWFGGPKVGLGWGFHQTLLLAALLVNAARYGVRRSINWPVLALAVVYALNLAFAELDPKVDPLLMLSGFGVLALPWTFTQVVLAPGSRRVCAITISVLPILSVAIGAVAAALDMQPFFRLRLTGATGNAAVFALLAFTGFAVALHESTRRGRPLLGVVAAVNLALVVFSGTRMAIFAGGLFLLAYMVASPNLVVRWRERWIQLAVGAGLLLAAGLYYWPTLVWRMFEPGGQGFRMSSRVDLWSFYYDRFLMSPVFGRGLGDGFVGALHWLRYDVPAPHNEYLHLLVVGGVVGAVACFAAIALWCRQLWRKVATNDRSFLLALLPALAAYAVTDNVLIYATGLALFAYLGVLLTRPAPGLAEPHRRRRSRTSAAADEQTRSDGDATNRRASALLAVQHKRGYVAPAGRLYGGPADAAQNARGSRARCAGL